jgi:hypothetical protein
MDKALGASRGLISEREPGRCAATSRRLLAYQPEFKRVIPFRQRRVRWRLFPNDGLKWNQQSCGYIRGYLYFADFGFLRRLS